MLAALARLVRAATPNNPPGRPNTPGPFFDPLEPRTLLSFSWSSDEVFLLELVNRARANPQAESQRYAVDLTEGLTEAELTHLVPQEPLALNEALTKAARLGSRDMADRAFFDHVNPDGLDPTDRAVAQGYSVSAGENIAAGYPTVEAAHIAWLKSLGHRKNVLSLHDTFDEEFHYDEFGAGFYFPPSDAGTRYVSYYTQLFGYQGFNPKVYLLGVAFDDANSNNFYDIDEGLDQVRIDVFTSTALPTSTPKGTYTTDAAGNYQIALNPGTYRVVFTNMKTGRTKTVNSVTIADVNVKLDAKASEITGSPAADGRAAVGAVVSGSYRPESPQAPATITITTLDPFGRPLVFQQDSAGAWKATDLHAWLGGPLLTKQVTSWTDPKDGNTYAAAPAPIGLLLFRQERADGSWELTNLTESIAGSAIITSDITVFTDRENTVKIAGRDSAGHIVLYQQLPFDGQASRFSWSFVDLSRDHLTPQGLATPAFTGNLASYVTEWNGQNIAGLDAAGRIHVVWWAPGLAQWRTDDLSAITGAPAISGGLTVYLTSWGGINLAGADPSGKVTVTWWVPSFGGDWLTNNLSDQFSGPALKGISMASYVTPWGGLNIAGLDNDGKLMIYWWAPGLTDWSISPISDLVAGAKLPAGSLRGLAAADGSISLMGRQASDAHVLRYWWIPGGQWQMEDLTLAS
ncbi:MAG: hypothetical protein IT436_09425 [Phycisphaerales bacterium]|nr:hypothetical protein [Phycisphaerales bacterium]